MIIQKDFIEFLKSKVSIVDVIAKKMKLTKSGKDYFGLCPFHAEKTPSFKVDRGAGLYYCFGCGAKGDVIDFVMRTENVSFSESVELIANMYGIPLPKKEVVRTEEPNADIYLALDAIKSLFEMQLKDKCGAEARRYLESRKISKESIQKFQLGFVSEEESIIQRLQKMGFSQDTLLKTGVFFQRKYSDELGNRFVGRIIFPILNSSGKCVGFGGRTLRHTDTAKYINSPESSIFLKSQHLYGYSIAKRCKSSSIILVEGYMDVIALHQAGFDGAVAPLGTAISETQISMCWQVSDNPIVALDGDSAGLKASYRWIDKMLSALAPGKSFRFARLPQNTDPDSLVFDNKGNIISEAITNAATLSDWLWDGAFSLYPAETPEQKAAVIKMLIEKIDLIKDASLKKLYFQHIKQRERDLYRRKFNPTKNVVNIKPAIPVKEKIEKILLVTIINHPYMIDKVVEHLARLEFNCTPIGKLKDRILDLYGQYFVCGEFDKYIAGIHDLANNAADIEAEVELHASFVSKKATDENAVEGWHIFCEKYLCDPVMAEDLQLAANRLKSNFLESDWQRLKALKKEVLFTRNKRK